MYVHNMIESRKNTELKKQNHLCQVCGKKLNRDETFKLDETILCEECFHKEQDLRAIILEDLAVRDSSST